MVAPGTGRGLLDAAAGVPAVRVLSGPSHDAERPGAVRRRTRGVGYLSHGLSQRRNFDRRANQRTVAVGHSGSDFRGDDTNDYHLSRGILSQQRVAGSAGTL